MLNQNLTSILVDLNNSSNAIKASAIASAEGLTMSAQLPAGADQGLAGALSAALLSMGHRGAEQFALGQMEQIVIKGEHGQLLITGAGVDSVLAVQSAAGAELPYLKPTLASISAHI
ncbi:MAG: roadblock/LC7 domain-containing protein [Halothiobacillaceae bacterium]|nr:roadblock/LC7 domain-containing protein [Halothiobacillaceae bacterium]